MEFCGDAEAEEEVGEDAVAFVVFGFNGEDRFVVFVFSEKIFMVVEGCKVGSHWIAGGCCCLCCCCCRCCCRRTD